MAWLSDEEYTYRQDCKEKKSVAASAHKQRTHCGRGGSVRFPHDNLTKKELRAMSGACTSYRMGEPMSWEVFKAMPDDLKGDYIRGLRNKFGVSNPKIADMMGIHPVTFNKHVKCLNLGRAMTDSKFNEAEWDAFLHPGMEPQETADEDIPVEVEEGDVITRGGLRWLRSPRELFLAMAR